MNKKAVIISILAVLALAIFAGGFWKWKEIKKVEEVKRAEEQRRQEEERKNESQINQNKEIGKIKLPDIDDWRNAKWLVYRDEKNKFEIKYPETFSADIVDISKRKNYRDGDVLLMHKDTLRYIRELNYGAAQIDNSVYISIKDNSSNLSLVDWIVENNKNYNWSCNNKDDNNKTDCKKEEIINLIAKPITINGIEAMLMSEKSIGDNSIVLFKLKNKKIVQFYYEYGSYDMNNGDNFFKKIIESFSII